MITESIEFATANGDTTAYVAKPESGNGKAVMLIHEWWGLNDHIKDIAGRYAAEGFIAIAPDLYRGKVATDPENALGITGYCMGGTFALRAACEVEGIAAAVPFYGDIPEESVLAKLRVPTIFVSGTRDGWITPAKVAELEAAAEKHQLPVESLKYDADHAFFNNTRPEVFNEDAASDAWSRAVAFFNSKL